MPTKDTTVNRGESGHPGRIGTLGGELAQSGSNMTYNILKENF